MNDNIYTGLSAPWPVFWRLTCDNWNFNPSNPCLYVGGQYNNHNANYGLFYINYNSVSNTNSNIGARFLSERLKIDLDPIYPLWNLGNAQGGDYPRSACADNRTPLGGDKQVGRGLVHLGKPATAKRRSNAQCRKE